MLSVGRISVAFENHNCLQRVGFLSQDCEFGIRFRELFPVASRDVFSQDCEFGAIFREDFLVGF